MKNPFSILSSRNFIFGDVGARGGLEEPWASFRNFIDVVSFEPDQEEYEELIKRKTDRDIVLPYALFNEEKKLNLNLTKSSGCSSIYEPNYTFLKRFPDVDRFTVEKKEIIKTTTLDTLYEKKIIKNLDFIKIDTQGSELDILRGGVKILNEKILGVQIEVEFKPLYTSQPLFAEVDRFIRDHLGLVLFDIKKVYWKYKYGRGIGSNKGQLIFGDALYFRDPYELPKWCDQISKTEAENKMVMACFMGIIYGYPDYSLCLLEQLKTCQWMKTEKIDNLKSIVKATAKRLKYSGKGYGIIWKYFNLIVNIFAPEHEGWGSGEHHLGSRKKFGVFY